MNKDLIAESSTTINADPKSLWDVLTNSEKIKKYLYGTQTDTNWEENSPIVFSGEYEGQRYEDKGNVLKNEPYNLLQYNYWSSFSGMDDLPENYAIISYHIEPIDDSTVRFTWHQQGFASEEGKCHTQDGLATMLEKIKELAEESA